MPNQPFLFAINDMISVRVFFAAGTTFAAMCFFHHDRIIPSLLLFVCSVVAQFLIPSSIIINVWHLVISLVLALVPVAAYDHLGKRGKFLWTNSSIFCISFLIEVLFLVCEPFLA